MSSNRRPASPDEPVLGEGKNSAKDSGYVVRAVSQASRWQEDHICTVRGVVVQQLEKGVPDDRGIVYARCRFPDGSIRMVNAGNIRIQKVKSNGKIE